MRQGFHENEKKVLSFGPPFDDTTKLVCGESTSLRILNCQGWHSNPNNYIEWKRADSTDFSEPKEC